MKKQQWVSEKLLTTLNCKIPTENILKNTCHPHQRRQVLPKLKCTQVIFLEKKKYCRNISGISPKANSLKLKIQEAIKVYFFLFFFCNNGYVTRLMAERGVKPSSNLRTWSLHCIITHFPEHWESLHNSSFIQALHHTIYTSTSEMLSCMPTVHIINNNNKFKLLHGGPAWQQDCNWEKRMYFWQRCRAFWDCHLLEPAFSKYIPTPTSKLKVWSSLLQSCTVGIPTPSPFSHSPGAGHLLKGNPLREFWMLRRKG